MASEQQVAILAIEGQPAKSLTSRAQALAKTATAAIRAHDLMLAPP